MFYCTDDNQNDFSTLNSCTCNDVNSRLINRFCLTICCCYIQWTHPHTFTKNHLQCLIIYILRDREEHRGIAESFAENIAVSRKHSGKHRGIVENIAETIAENIAENIVASRKTSRYRGKHRGIAENIAASRRVSRNSKKHPFLHFSSMLSNSFTTSTWSLA